MAQKTMYHSTKKCHDAGVSITSLDCILSVKKMQRTFCTKFLFTWPQKGGGQNLMTGNKKRNSKGRRGGCQEKGLKKIRDEICLPPAQLAWALPRCAYEVIPWPCILHSLYLEGSSKVIPPRKTLIQRDVRIYSPGAFTWSFAWSPWQQLLLLLWAWLPWR